MERMKDLTQQYVEQLQNIVKDLRDEKFELEEENKKLNTIIENTKIEQEADRKHIEELEKENERLKKENEELQEYKRMYEGLG